MSLWNFLGEFALFNMICDLFSGKPKPPYGLDDFTSSTLDTNSSIAEIQRRIDELEAMRDSTGVTSGYYLEILEAIDATRELLECKVELEKLQKELDDLRNGFDEYDCDIYDDDDDW